MRYTNKLGYAVCSFVALAVFSGCSAAGTSSSTPASPGMLQPQAVDRPLDAASLQFPPSTSVFRLGAPVVRKPDRSAGFADPDASAKAAFIGVGTDTNDVYVYTAAGKPIATITGFSEPQGLAVNAAGDVYVADTSDNEIPVYKNNYKTRQATLRDPGQYPVDVGYDETSGLVAVTNILTTSGGAGSVSFYAKGATTPCATVASAAWSRVYFGAFDAAGDFYIDGEDSSGETLIGVVIGGCSATTITTLKSKTTIGFPGNVAVSPKDKLLVGDQETSIIYTFDLPAKGVLGTPIAKTTLTGDGSPGAFALTVNGTDLWALSTPDALKYAYPAGGSPLKTVSLGDISWLVVLPAAQP